MIVANISLALIFLLTVSFVKGEITDDGSSRLYVDFDPVREYEYEYENAEYEIAEYEQKETDTPIVFASTESRLTPPPTLPGIGDSEERYRAAYICMDVQRMLCLGISTDSVATYNPDDLIHLQVKRRERNEMRGLDFLKMRWELDIVEGTIRLASAKSLCLAKMARDDAREVVLRPCDSTSKGLIKWNIPFAAESDSDPVSAQLGTISLRSAPKQCLTLMRCDSTKGHCSPTSDVPYDADKESFDPSLLSGAYVKLAPCQSKAPNQVMRQIRNCSPGCSTILFENNICDEACNNVECYWDNGACPIPPPDTDIPTTSPTKAKTSSPIIAPSKSPSASAPTKSPTTSKPTSSPTHLPTTASPSKGPTRKGTQQPTVATSTPTQKPTTLSPSSTPTQEPLPTDAPSNAPTQNLTTTLGAAPAQSIEGESVQWWAWLILAILLVIFIGVLVVLLRTRRARQARQMREANDAARNRATKMLNETLDDGTVDVELGAYTNKSSSFATQGSTHAKLEDGGDQGWPAPRIPPKPSREELRGEGLATLKNEAPSRVSFDHTSFVEDDEMRRKRLEEERESKARKMARRSVMKLLNAMNDLEQAFDVAEKELDQVSQAPPPPAKETEHDFIKVSLDDDGENRSPNRVSGSTPLKKRSAHRQLNQLEKKETQDLVMELKSRKFEQAIAKVEKAIGSLERNVTNEQVRMLHGDEEQSSMRSSNGGTSYGDLDTTVNSVDYQGPLHESRTESGRGTSYIVSRTSRGATLV